MALPNYFRIDSWVKTTLGPAITGAHVYYLSQPTTNVPTSEALGPPSPLATIYTDSTGKTTESQPLQTDGFGHVETYLAPGIYTVLIYLNGTLQEILADQAVGVAGLAGNVPTTAAVTSLNALTGAVTLAAGANISLGTVGSTITITGSAIAISLKHNGTANSSQSTLNIANTDGSISITDAGSGTLNLASIASAANAPLSSYSQLGVVSTGASIGTNSTAAAQVNQFGGGVATVTAATASEPRYVQLQTPNGGGLLAIVGDNLLTSITNAGTALSYTLGILKVARFRVQMVSGYSTSLNLWAGCMAFTSSSQISNQTNNTPTPNFVGFRFSSGAGYSGDTHWQCICQTSASNSTVVDSGVAPAVGVGQTLAVVPTNGGGTITFYINGTLVATISTNVPATSVVFEDMAGAYSNTVNFSKFNVSYTGFAYNI